MRWLPKFEQVLLIFGLSLLAIYVGGWAREAILSRWAVENFNQRELGISARSLKVESIEPVPDFTLWSPKRIQAYRQSLAAYFAPGIGILRIPKIHVEAPLLEGTDDLTLNRGVGRIEGTAAIGEKGNIGIAGHRDGFFRGLKDVGVGDQVELVTQNSTEIYTIDRTIIVDPGDVSILQPRPHPSLTLVTCYPFYFVGSAPKRYIVQASISDPSGFEN
jgi:sortase A